MTNQGDSKRPRSDRQFWSKPTTLLIVGLLVVGLLIWIGYRFPDYSGFGEHNAPRDGVESTKRVWDWLDLIVVPAILGLAAYWFNRQEGLRNEAVEAARDSREERIQQRRERESALQSYLDRMAELLIEHGPIEKLERKPLVRNIARVRTLTVLRELEWERMLIVLQFLFESNLINGDDPIIDLAEVNLSDVQFKNANLRNVNLSKTILTGANLEGVELQQAVLREAMLQRAMLTGADLTDADLTKANLVAADLSEIEMDRATLKGVELGGSNLREALLRQANLSYAILNRANLRGAKLNRANLAYATLHNADLTGATLSHTDLKAADLENADLQDAILSNADLKAANLTKAILQGAILIGADLQNAFVTERQLSGVRNLWRATMPNGTTYDGRFNLEHDIELARDPNVYLLDDATEAPRPVDTSNDEDMARFYSVSVDEHRKGQQWAEVNLSRFQ